MSDFPKTVKEFSPDEQPQEKAEKYGIHVLSLSELWAVILRAGQPGVPITQLTRELMAINDGKLRKLERRSRKELMTIPGIGPVKALQIEAVLEIMRRYSREKIGEKIQIKCAKDIHAYMYPIAAHLNHEKIWILHLSRSNVVLGCSEVSSGGTSSTVFDLKTILKDALLTPECETIVLCHNHPSGNNRPSGPDDQITRLLNDGCRYLGLKLIDHVIIAGDDYFSYADNGRLN